MRIFFVRLAVIFSHLVLLRPCGEVLAMYADVTIDLAAIVKTTEGDEEMAAWCGVVGYIQSCWITCFFRFPTMKDATGYSKLMHSVSI